MTNKLNSPIQIGNINIESRAFLAPLAGVSDFPFRSICKSYGAPFMYTEMVSAKGLLYNSKNTKDLLYTDSYESPIAVQLFGSEIFAIEKAVDMLEEYDFKIIDFNMGCPVKKIVRNGEGVSLMKRPELASSIIKAIKRITNKPVSVKFRRGCDMNVDNSLEFAKIMEDSGADMITIHGRYGSQMYSGKSDTACIKKAADAVKIPVFASGDINSYQDAVVILNNSNISGVMVARGVLGRPWIFREMKKLKEYTPDIQERKEVIIMHAKKCVEMYGESMGVRKMRTYLSWYTKGLPSSAKMRNDLSSVSTLSEIEEFTNRL